MKIMNFNPPILERCKLLLGMMNMYYFNMVASFLDKNIFSNAKCKIQYFLLLLIYFKSCL